MTQIIPTGPGFEDFEQPLPPGEALRNNAAYRHARRHSLVVRALKFVLPLAAIAAIVGFGGVFLLSLGSGEGVDVGGIAYTDGKLVMENPKLDGHTDTNLPYNLNAARAIQDLSNPDLISLEQIAARIALNETETAVIHAATAVFDKQKNTLDINSPIHVETSSGMAADLKSAKVNMKEGSLSSSEPIAIDLNGSTITADSMAVSERGKVLVFENRVRVMIPPERLRPDGETQ